MHLFFITLVALLDIAGMVSAKYWSLSKNNWWLVLTVLTFSLAGIFFTLALRYQGLAITNILWTALATIGITSLGYFVFKEQISTLQFVGIGTILLGFILVNWQVG